MPLNWILNPIQIATVEGEAIYRTRDTAPATYAGIFVCLTIVHPIIFARHLKSFRCTKSGQPGWLSSLPPPLVQGVILETWDRVPHRASFFFFFSTSGFLKKKRRALSLLKVHVAFPHGYFFMGMWLPYILMKFSRDHLRMPSQDYRL